MTCDRVRALFPLALYEELSFDDEEKLEQHVTSCAACAEEWAVNRKVHYLLSVAAPLAPPPALLRQCREDLFAQIVAAPPRRRWTLPRWPRWAWQPAAACACLAAGFVAARATVPVVPLPPPAPPTAMRVRYVEPAPDGQVRLRVEESKQQTITGRPQDDPIRRLLLAATQESTEPGIQVESIDLLRQQPQSPEVQSALLTALRHDTNAGVRLKALEGLRLYAAQPEVRRTLEQVLLADRDPAVRTQAIDLLIQNRGAAVAGILQQLMAHEPNRDVRQECQRALRSMNASLETF